MQSKSDDQVKAVPSRQNDISPSTCVAAQCGQVVSHQTGANATVTIAVSVVFTLAVVAGLIISVCVAFKNSGNDGRRGLL